jgi:AcrR family transcriptional regulator
MALSTGPGRVNQKLRTRAAILDATRQLARSGREVTMPDVAGAALVSEATAYRYFPDLASLLQEALAGTLPSPAQALPHIAACSDVVERVACATEVLLRHVHAYQGAVRATMAASISRPAQVAGRPGLRFGLIDYALAPPADIAAISRARLAQLRLDLAVVVSAEAFFTLTDLCGLTPEDAIASAVRTARTLTLAALAPPPPPVTRPA